MPCARVRGRVGVRWPACGHARPASARDAAGPSSPPPCRPAALCRPVLGVPALSRGRPLCCQLAATAWVGALGLTQSAEVTRPSMLLTALGLRPATIGVGRVRPATINRCGEGEAWVGAQARTLEAELLEHARVLVELGVGRGEQLVSREDAVGAAHEHDALLELAEGHAPRREAHLG